MEKSIKTAAVYIRVSTDEQLVLSPESQLEEIHKYAENNNIIILNDYLFIEDEGISGRNAEKRVKFQEMIATAKITPKPFDIILVWKFARFARNQEESVFYKSLLRKKLNIDVISISEPIPPGMYGRLMETIIEWQDEFYSYNLRGEVIRSMRQNAAKGNYNSLMPLGYGREPNPKHKPGSPADSIVINTPYVIESEAAIVREIFQLFLTHDKNYIVRYLNDNGIKTKNDRVFTAETVSYILTNPFYIGKIRWNRRTSSDGSKYKDESEWIIADSHHEPIISMDLWNAACEKNQLLLDIRSKYAHPVSHTKHWLSGIVKCSVCGKSLSFKYDKRIKNPCNTFQCLGYRNGLHKESQAISEKKLTAAIMESLQRTLTDRNDSFEIIHASNTNDTEMARLKSSLQNIDTKFKRIKEAYVNGIDSLDEYRSNKEMIEKQKNVLENRMKELTIKTDSKDLKEKFYENVKNVIDILNSDVDYQVKGEAIRSIILYIEFFKSEKRLEFHYYVSV